MDEVILTDREARELLLDILDAIEAAETGDIPFSLGTRLWEHCLVLVSRLNEGGGAKAN